MFRNLRSVVLLVPVILIAGLALGADRGFAQVRPLPPLSDSLPSSPRDGSQALSPRRTNLQYEPPAVSAPRPALLQPIANDLKNRDSTSTTTLPSGFEAHAQVWQANDRQVLMSPGHLNDIAFINAQIGVAVGNQGLVWRTTDGGRRWQSIRTEWPGELKSVVFADAQNGWIVGGRALPIRGLHEGVVLRTQDGGVTWKLLASTLLPMLTQVGYDHQQQKLWAVSEPDGQYPTGLFESYDLGQNWNDLSIKVDAIHHGSLTQSPNPALADLPRPMADSLLNVAIPIGEEWILSNRRGIFRCIGEQAIPVVITVPPAIAHSTVTSVRFREIQQVGNRLLAIGTDGELYSSRNRGQKWDSVGKIPDEIAANGLVISGSAGESLWVAPRVGQQIYHFNALTQEWSPQSLPQPTIVNSMFFADERVGWIAGTGGQVFGTQDGGRTWQFLHRAHQGLAVLILGTNATDIPGELVAHLAVNHGLQVGVLCGGSNVPPMVMEQAFWQNEVATVLFDPVTFDPNVSREQASNRAIRYLDALDPRVVLVCPPRQQTNPPLSDQTQRQVQTSLWVDAAQHRHASAKTGLALLATLANGDGETSTSSHALATNVGQLLHDIAWPSNVLIAAWNGSSNAELLHQVEPRSWGIRRLVTLAPSDMSWFHPQASAQDSFGRSLPSRPVRARTSATNLDAINQMARKTSWIHQMTEIPTVTLSSRDQWQKALSQQLWIPESLHSIWISDLASYCESKGDARKATLARWSVLQDGFDEAPGLAILLPALTSLISDESQWETRLEARNERLQRFAELQELFALEEAEGELSEEERRLRALHRFGVEPGMENQVPAEAVEKILLLDQAQREATRQGRIKPDPEIVRQAAVPQARMVKDTQSKQFENKLGQLQHFSTTVSWDTPLTPDENSVASTPVIQATSILDASREQRFAMADKLIRQAESTWPSLNGLPTWWRLKARVRQERRDVAQAEVAWNKIIEMAQHPFLVGTAYQPTLPLVEIEQERFVSLAMAEYGERFRLESLGSQQVVHLASQQTPGVTRTQVRSLPVRWTLERPFLDGRLNEPIWQDGSINQSIVLAHDEQYLYVALRLPASLFPSLPNSANTASDLHRNSERDQAEGHDVVILSLDTDADDAQAFEFVFDAQGQLLEHQNGQIDWNPAFFIARQAEADTIVTEMAIDLEDLSPTRDGMPWRVKLQSRSSGQLQTFEQAWIQLSNLFGE